jgi:hypothetical protein
VSLPSSEVHQSSTLINTPSFSIAAPKSKQGKHFTPT